jgi:MerR family transcriptional regulator, copper efflux regulator
MRIGELAGRAGVSPSAIRFYERRGLLPEPERTTSGYRDYGEDALARLAFVRSGQEVGLTLAELRDIIAARDLGEVPCGHVTDLIRRRAAEVGTRIEQLKGVQSALLELAARAERLDPADCSSTAICHILQPAPQ